MEQTEFTYKFIMDLEFKEEFNSDSVFFDKYGYDYSIVTLQLSPKIYVDWDKTTRKCKLVRLKNLKTQDIGNEMPIFTEEQLINIIAFFKNREQN